MKTTHRSTGRVGSLALAIFAIAAVSCMSTGTEPEASSRESDVQAGKISMRILTPTSGGMAVVSRTQDYRMTPRTRTAATQMTLGAIATQQSVFIPRQVGSAAAAAKRPMSPAKKLKSRLLAAKVVKGKEVALAAAYYEGSDLKAPAHMLVRTVNGIPTWTFLPRYRKAGARFVLTGGTFNTYDEVGGIKRSTSFELSDGTTVATTRSPLDVVADAVSVPIRSLFGVRDLMAQEESESCASDFADSLLEGVLFTFETDFIGSVLLGWDLLNFTDCLAGSGMLPTMHIVCERCTEYVIDYYVWIDDWGNENWEPITDVYCPPCGNAMM